jgi:hypothetical protein
MRIRLLLLLILLMALSPRTSGYAAPVTDHPRLWLRPAEVTRLRAWAVPTNPLYAEGLLPVAERAKQDMDEKRVPQEDCGQRAYTEYPTEAYAQLFAFLSLIHPDAAVRTDYANRARTLLMYIMNIAAKGSAKEGERTHRCVGDPDTAYYPPFRDPIFFTEDSDRLRWHGEAFPLTVDWIYPILTKEDKATIAKVFTRWGQEIIERGYHHPEPLNVIRDPKLLQDRAQVRWAGNNYFAAHARNLGMMSLALDAADSTPALTGYLKNATGAWLYLFDELSRTDSRGGLLPEGFEYSPQTASYIIQLLLAIKTAGHADPELHGREVILEGNPFWDDFVTGYLYSLSPATLPDPERGDVYQAAWYGDGQRYQLPDFIDAFGSLGWYDQLTGNTKRLNALRWIQTHTAPGGATRLVDRTRRADYFRSTILYFTLFDPAAPPASDPRSSVPTHFIAPGMGRLYDRISWESNSAWVTYSLGWNSIDHQMADGNHVEFYRNGEWLTKARVGYANIAEGIASSEFRNTLAIQNKRPADRSDDDWRIDLWKRGSQWNLVSTGNPGPLLSSFGERYTFMGGDATNLYNSEYEQSTEVKHASRGLVWLKPDTLVIYDRADAPANRFKRVWFQLPAPAKVDGLTATLTTAKQSFTVQVLLPEKAKLSMADPRQENIGETAATDDPMKQRLFTDSPGVEKARFLHILHGADKGASPVKATLIRSQPGAAAFEGAVVGNIAVLFAVEMGQPVERLSYSVPPGVRLHVITGLTPNAKYDVKRSGDTVMITKGTTQAADLAGVLTVTP